MTEPRNAACGEIARLEEQTCREFGPAQVEAGAMTQAALDTEIAAWAMMAELFEADGRHPAFDIYVHALETVIDRFGKLEAVTSAALARRTAAVERGREDGARRERVFQVHRRITRSRQHWQTCLDLTARLRDRAREAA